MSLINEAMESCVKLIKDKPVPDGEGGHEYAWREGEEFKASFDFQTSVEAKIAEKQGVTGLWNIYVNPAIQFVYHEVFKRLSDGQIFRVTSKDDKKTPDSAKLKLKLISAEEWELTE